MPRKPKNSENISVRGRGGRDFKQASTTRNPYLNPWRENGSTQSHFSLDEEARNTERHHAWNSDLRLRNSRITFISAGESKAEELTQIPQDSQEKRDGIDVNAPGYPVNLDNGQVPIGPKHTPTTPTSLPDIQALKMSLSEDRISSPTTKPCNQSTMQNPSTTTDDPFFIDLVGSGENLPTDISGPKTLRSASLAPSDSSEEIVLFTGRRAVRSRRSSNGDDSRKLKKSHATQSNHSSIPKLNNGSIANIVDDPVQPSAAIHSSTFVTAQVTRLTDGPNINPDESSVRRTRDPASTITRKYWRRRRPCSRKTHDSAKVLADYIANMNSADDLGDASGEFMLNSRDLGGSDDNQRLESEEGQEDGLAFNRDAWDGADLEDVDDLSTSSEMVTSVQYVLSKREKPSGVQYLVVANGFTTDDARWLPLEALDVPEAAKEINRFEEARLRDEPIFDDSDDSTNDLEIAMDVQADLDDLADEQDLLNRRQERMDDEQLARLLSKQEELGLGSDDLMIFDGEDNFGEILAAAQLDGAGASAASPIRPKRTKRDLNSFPSATAFADVLDQDPYNGFDVMDQDRPSLRKRTKGRRGKPALELSDSELENSISMAWEKDRTKKKTRKQEREDLRAQGLLGRKKDKPDLKAKYSEGMSMEEIKDEIRSFLMSSSESLPLPPMGKDERKIVHQIANVFKLNSKSVGGGKSRFPVLHRTARTLRYSEESLRTIEAMLSSRRFLPRLDKGRKRGTPAGRGRGGGFASAGVSYRDGEVVGAAAPELGQENKGRAMLEKMGWSTGTTLGALNNNRGIAQPVTQTVKTGKAGLG